MTEEERNALRVVYYQAAKAYNRARSDRLGNTSVNFCYRRFKLAYEAMWDEDQKIAGPLPPEYPGMLALRE